MRIKTCCRQRRTSGRVSERVFFAALPLQQQERISQTNQSDMVVPTRPASTFVMIQPELFLQLLVVLLYAPAQLRQTGQPLQRRLNGQVGKPVLGRCCFILGPLDQDPNLFQLGVVSNMTVSGLDAAGGETALLRPRLPSRQRTVFHSSAARAMAIASNEVGLSL